MAKTKKTKIIGASNAMSRGTYPQGLPEALVVRGTGQTLMDKLATMNEVAEDLIGVIIIHVDADQQSLLGPELLLRGPAMTLGLKVKSIWGEVSSTSHPSTQKLNTNTFQGAKGHTVNWCIKPENIVFPTEGPRRLISEWQDAVSSGAFEYIDNKGQRKTQGLDKLKGIQLGASLRYNVVPTSIGKLAVYAQVRQEDKNHKPTPKRYLDFRSSQDPWRP